jgi:gliding motility-associated-like protein
LARAAVMASPEVAESDSADRLLADGSPPSAFSPNGDGNNDYLYPLDAYKATGLVFRIYNRNGRVVFETRDWTKKWDGRVNGSPEPAGVYVWTLEYTDAEH